MVIDSNNIMQKVEEMVCDCVNDVMADQERGVVTSEDIYIGKKNIPFVRATARNFAFDVLHNRYGFSYSVIAQRADVLRDSVIRCVRKCHSSVRFDRTYQRVQEKIDNKLKEWYGE